MQGEGFWLGHSKGAYPTASDRLAGNGRNAMATAGATLDRIGMFLEAATADGHSHQFE